MGATILEEYRRSEACCGTAIGSPAYGCYDRDLHAGTTVLATGAWTRLLGDELGVKLPTKPVKGH